MGPNGSDGALPPDDLERDEPIVELRALAIEPTEGFGNRIRRRIERKETVNHALWFSWHLPGAVLLAFLDVVLATIGFDGSDNGGLP